MGVHDGHRERLRARFAEHGLESFNELNALELLLCYAIPRRDTNEIAHRLLDAFGSLSGVFQASMQELTSIPGIGENAATLILMVPQIVKKAHVSKAKETKIIRNSTDAGNYLLPYFLDEPDEIVMMLCLDNKRAVICCREMGGELRRREYTPHGRNGTEGENNYGHRCAQSSERRSAAVERGRQLYPYIVPLARPAWDNVGGSYNRRQR